MKEIELTQGLVAFVDDEDYEKLSKHKWRAEKRGDLFYAYRSAGKHGGYAMHREILPIPLGKEIDHTDRNGLNNQKSNLRICTVSQNQANTKSRTGGTSKFKGVGWFKSSRKWRALIKVKGQLVYLGLFVTEEDAAIAYNNAALRHFGEFARLNSVEARN